MSAKDLRYVLAAKRDGKTLAPGEIRGFVESFAKGKVPDYLAAAFLMAVYIRGLGPDETLELTRAMVDSGRTLPLGRVIAPKVDKHSTGGVADGVTLVFVPLAASLGLAVAKLSGRGLGHTGGTIDKLESIPGFRTDLSPEELERQVDSIGCAIATQSADLVPADAALYALRDLTGTVASLPLIAASVMSKKLAVESDLILLDVKAGSGAFMKTQGEATKLARTCVELAEGFGRRARAGITDMSQPLGEAVGNAIEVAEAVDVLLGRAPGRLRDLAVVFAGEALSRLTGVGMGEGRGRAAEALDSGEALARFARMVEAQGGDPRVCEDPWSVLPKAAVVVPVRAESSGFVGAVDAAELGRVSVDLGAGRTRKGDPIDPGVGIVFRPKVGDRLEAGEEIGLVHARAEEEANIAARRVLSALTVDQDPAAPSPLVFGWYGE